LTTVIRFDKVSKKFILHHERARSFQELVVGLLRRNNRSREEFWALRDVSFAVEQGETVGIIGPNGAGKSTLLKLAARVIEPTSGRIAVRGRIGALLELGAGFHPDLTGRENIYLNGSILGLSRAEIRRRLDDIIGFAELERFIDVPVKHYSSGMYVRLGFSIAVHTDPEILLVDEVLAVGDQAFQRKCIQRISQLREGGVTILLVSHNMGHIAHMCDRALWLQDGEIQAIGISTMVVDQYVAFSDGHALGIQVVDPAKMKDAGAQQQGNRWGTFEAEITKVELLGIDGSPTSIFQTGDFFCIRIHYHAHVKIESPAFGMAFYRTDGVHINGPNSVQDGCEIPYINGTGFVDYEIEHLPLNYGEYEITVAIYNHDSTVAYDHHHRMYRFTVRSPSLWHEEGLVHIPATWRHISESE